MVTKYNEHSLQQLVDDINELDADIKLLAELYIRINQISHEVIRVLEWDIIGESIYVEVDKSNRCEPWTESFGIPKGLLFMSIDDATQSITEKYNSYLKAKETEKLSLKKIQDEKLLANAVATIESLTGKKVEL